MEEAKVRLYVPRSCWRSLSERHAAALRYGKHPPFCRLRSARLAPQGDRGKNMGRLLYAAQVALSAASSHPKSKPLAAS
jgi:hypothetical protein